MRLTALNTSLISFLQGARGFPGTPGLPGIKGHRVSLEEHLKHKSPFLSHVMAGD